VIDRRDFPSAGIWGGATFENIVVCVIWFYTICGISPLMLKKKPKVVLAVVFGLPSVYFLSKTPPKDVADVRSEIS